MAVWGAGKRHIREDGEPYGAAGADVYPEYDYSARVELPEPREPDEEAVCDEPPRPARQSVSFWTVLGFAAAAALLVISLLARAELTAIIDECTELEESIDELRDSNRRLQIEYESAFSPEEVEAYATEILGMRAPESDQIKYISVSSGDRAEVLGSDRDGETFVDTVSDFFFSVAEYFR